MLEFLVLPLRGAERDLPKDVRSWVKQLRLDILVAGRPARITIDAEAGWERQARATISTADTEDALRDSSDELRLLAEAVGLGDIEQVIGQFMLDTLRMDRTQMWMSGGGADGDGVPQSHGWTAYFGACYLNHGGDKLLLGDVPVPGLPGKLMELFVDLPYSSTLAELAVAKKREERTESQVKRRAEGDAQARAGQRTAWRKELARLETEIAGLRATDAPDVSGLLREVDVAAGVLRAARETFERTDAALQDARAARVRAEQAQLDATETWQARRVLGRLKPTCCPRCEVPVTQERRSQESTSAACSVCTRPLPEIEPEMAQALLAELHAAVIAAREAEAEIARRHGDDDAIVGREQARYGTAQQQLREALTGDSPMARLYQAELEVADLRGRLAATEPAETPQPPGNLSSAAVVAATHKRLLKVVEEAARTLLPEMDAEIIKLCRLFGVQNLDSVRLTRGAQVNAVKAKQKTRFDQLSRGDRLRMRIATVIALLRVGKTRGVTSHPGLLIIDSIAAEELNKNAARVLITELQKIAEELPSLQVIFTTAHPEFVKDLLPKERVITAAGAHLF